MDKPTYHLRSEPSEVWNSKAKEVFHLDDTWRPREYVKNKFKDNGDGTVTDHSTGLMWEKDGSGRHLNFWTAKKYILDLNRKKFAGYNDWRLPTIPELVSLLEQDKQSNDLYRDLIFGNMQKWCWSADKRWSKSSMWYISFSYGKIGWLYLNGSGGIKAVRSIQ